MARILGGDIPGQLVAAGVKGSRGNNANGARFGEGDAAEVKLGDKSQKGRKKVWIPYRWSRR